MDRKSLRNPFDSDVVTSPDQTLVADVASIHRDAFTLCAATYDDVARHQASLSVLLNGEAGCGKTHLLSRFRHWLAGELDGKPAAPPAAVVAIQMETAPSQIWRHIRRRFAEQLTRMGAGRACALDGILTRFAAQHAGDLQRALDESEIADLTLDLARILAHFAAGTERRLCRAWLAGEGLADADLNRLGLPSSRPEEVEEDYAESGARRMVLAIARLSAPSPVVFFFDQLEALGIAQQADRGFAAFSKAGAALMDGTTNVLTISTVLSTFLRDLENGSMQSDYARVGKRRLDLHALNPQQASALVASRLALTPELAGQEIIPARELEALFQAGHGSCNARRLIHESRRMFARWQELAPPPEETLEIKFEELRARSAGSRTPEETDAILAHGLPVVFDLLGQRTASDDNGLSIQNGASGSRIVFINQRNMTSLAAKLKGIVEKARSGEPLCLLRDARLPISPGARTTLDRVKKIEEAGGRFLRVEAEALAALDAMRQLLTAATSGDLSLNGETVEARTVREWLAKNLPSEAEDLASELLGGTSPVGRETTAGESDPDALLEMLGRRKVVPLDEAAAAISWSKEKIEAYARSHPLAVRWFGGSRPVVCLAIASSQATEAVDAR